MAPPLCLLRAPTAGVRTQKIVPNDSVQFGTAVVVNQAGALISAPYSSRYFANILGNTQAYVWKGNQLVYAGDMPGNLTGTSIASSNNAAIIATDQFFSQYGSYECVDIVTVTPGGTTSPGFSPARTPAAHFQGP